MADIKQRESIKITRTIKIDVFRAGYAKLVLPLFEQINILKNGTTFAPMEYIIAIRNLLDQIERIKSEHFIRTAVECPNTVMDSPNYGIDILIQNLLPNPAYPATLSFIEIGTGNTTPATTDTALTTPTNRATISFFQDYGTTDAIVQTIFSDSQLSNATYYEMGTFCGGTSVIGSGQLFNHALFSSAYTKISGQDTSLQCDFAFS